MKQKLVGVLILILFILLNSSLVKPVSAEVTGPQPVLVWEKIEPSLMPSPRSGFAMTLIEPNQVGLLFGGVTSDPTDGLRYKNDTWLTDGRQWLEISTPHSPQERANSSLAYDSGRQEAVLFGGSSHLSYPPVYLNDTWTFDGVDWIQRATVTAPSPRISASVVYDPDHQRTYLFGGSYSVEEDITKYNDIWAWDGSNWQFIPLDVKPWPRDQAAIAYDPVHHYVLLYGGATIAAYLGDTWIWDGEAWTEVISENLPSLDGEAYPQMVFDATREQVLLVGNQWHDFDYHSETWAWDGQDWTKLQVERPIPYQSLYYSKLIYLPKMKTVALVSRFLEKLITPDNTPILIERQEVWVLVERYLQFIPVVSPMMPGG